MDTMQLTLANPKSERNAHEVKKKIVEGFDKKARVELNLAKRSDNIAALADKQLEIVMTHLTSKGYWVEMITNLANGKRIVDRCRSPCCQCECNG